MKFLVGIDLTVKGQRVEPNSDWQWSECCECVRFALHG
jgi:hypothetical protein